MNQYVNIWGEMGEEQASQWRFFQYLKDAQIDAAKVEGYKIVEGKELLSDQARAALALTEEGMRTMDWSSYRSTN
jgi:hypothetical protein